MSPLIGMHRTFEIETYGADVFNTSRFETGGLRHSLTVGADIFQDNVKVVDPISTADLFTPSGERTAGGAFIQDQVEIGSMLEFIVAGRFDAYELKGDTVDSDGTNFSPKATVVLKPFAETSLQWPEVLRNLCRRLPRPFSYRNHDWRLPSRTFTLSIPAEPGSCSRNGPEFRGWA